MSKPASNAPLTFRRAAEVLNQDDKTGRALRALVLAREAETGKRIATRLGGQLRPKMKVTLTALFQYLPELRAPKTEDQMMRQIRGYVEAIDDRIKERATEAVQSLVMPHFEDDRRRIASLEQTGEELQASSASLKGLVLKLSEQVAGLVGVPTEKRDLKPTG